MKLNQSQESSLQKYLRSNLRYRETYAEFYDHVLTSLENTTADIPFKDAVHNIIAEDFGGEEGMGAIEEKYKHTIFTELKKRYLNYAIDNLKFPGVLIILILVAIFSYMVKQPWFSLDVFLLNIIAIRVIPSILYGIMHLTSPRIYGAPLKSIKSTFFKWQNAIPAFVFFIAWSMMAPGPFKDQVWVQRITLPLMAIIMVLMALHSITYYKVYRDDLKARFTVR